MAASKQLLNNLKDPLKEMSLIRKGLKTETIETFLEDQDFLLKDILNRLHVPPSTYFTKKKNRQPLDAYTTEKFIRLIHVVTMATDIIGKEETKNWLHRKVPSLGDQAPINLLDTDIGHRLVEQALLQIKYGMYA